MKWWIYMIKYRKVSVFFYPKEILRSKPHKKNNFPNRGKIMILPPRGSSLNINGWNFISVDFPTFPQRPRILYIYNMARDKKLKGINQIAPIPVINPPPTHSRERNDLSSLDRIIFFTIQFLGGENYKRM